MAAEVAKSVIGKVVDLLFGAITTQIGYMWNCDENVEKYKNETEKLRILREKIQRLIDTNKLPYSANEWVKKAKNEITNAKIFLKEEANSEKTCFNIGICGNWCTLYHYGKLATKTTPLLHCQELGKEFERCIISVDTPTPGILDVYQNKNLDDIGTHKIALGNIIAAINDDSIQIIGIYGLGGVGKTTLALEVSKSVKNQFFVAFTTISQTVKVRDIKEDIGVATKPMMEGKKVLIILDDVWDKLNLEELGIALHMKCKILLTSRKEDVCDKMNVQRKICVDSLLFEDAWPLFKRVVGDNVETDSNLNAVAKKVVEECGGLPLMILAIGNALKGKSIDEWQKALTRLREHAPSHIDPDIEKAFTRLRLSYDFLSNEVQSCFLLCSMFPEDSRIPLENLVYYGVGQGRFTDLEDARDRVQKAVNILTSSSLLLNVDDKNYTRMHDVVRDVALFIASDDKNKILVKAGESLDEWLPRSKSVERYTGISIMSNDIRKLPNYKIHIPHIDTFLMQNNYEMSMISDEFIRGIEEVKVLDMARNRIASLPQSFKLLTNLRMLNLGRTDLEDISILGELSKLEILLLNYTGIKEISQEIGQLVNLRRLDFDGCRLCHIAPGVISKLWRLEELSINLRWMEEGIYDIVVEVMKLSKLRYLELTVPSFDVIPQVFDFGKLKGFIILVGKDTLGYRNRNSLHPEHHLIFEKVHLEIPLLKWTAKLIKSNPKMHLQFMENLNNILPTLYHEGFNELESIVMVACHNVSYLVDTWDWDKEVGEGEKCFSNLKHLHLTGMFGLKVLFNCPHQYISLSNVVTLHISQCNGLVRLLSVNVAQGLVNLERLTINLSKSLEEVIWGGDVRGEIEMVEDAAHIVFPRLSTISLTVLGSLKSFCSVNSTIEYPSLVDVTIYGCKNMNKWGEGSHYTPNLKFADHVPLHEPYAINDAVGTCHKPSMTSSER